MLALETTGFASVISIFDESVPAPFLRDALRCTLVAWREADRKCRDEFDEAERHDLFPIYRRAILERELRGAAARNGLSASPQRNHKKTSSFSRIASGRVIMTASAVRESREVVRYAEFRRSLARSSQLPLFGEAEPIDPHAPLYAILLHGPGAVDPDSDGAVSTARPGFVDIVFPAPIVGSKEGIAYIEDRVDLLMRYPDVIAGDTTVTTEVIADDVDAQLRTVRARKDAGA